MKPGTVVLFRGERYTVKRVHRNAGMVTIEDDEGCAVTVDWELVEVVEPAEVAA